MAMQARLGIIAATVVLGCSALISTAAVAVTPMVAAGQNSTVALKPDGTVWIWGGGNHGILGNGTTGFSTVPVQVPGLTGVTAIAASHGSLGGDFVLALKSDGTVWTWGYNYYGLGDGVSTASTIPIQIPGLTGVAAISAAADGHAMALRNDGTVWAWGNDNTGQLCDGRMGTYVQSSVPIQTLIVGATAVATVDGFTEALMGDGTVQGCGNGANGNLGEGRIRNVYATPVTARFGNGAYFTGATGLSTGIAFTLARGSDGTVWAWGDNSYGELGTNTTTQALYPVQTVNQDGTPFSGVTAVTAGTTYFAFALKSDGTLWGWGNGYYGQLANGVLYSTAKHPVPTQVAGLTNMVGVSAGSAHVVAVRSDGTVWTWGNNDKGQLGNGTRTTSAVPVQVTGFNLLY